MADSYHINQEAGLITVTVDGDFGLPAAISMGRAILGELHFTPTLPQLFDLRGLKTRRSSAESLNFREFVLHEYFARVRANVAIVVDDSLDTRSLAALYHLISRVDMAEMFDNYDQALRWLMRKEFALMHE